MEFDAQAGDAWSTLGKVAVGLVIANVALGLIVGIPTAIYALTAVKKSRDRQDEIMDEAWNRALSQADEEGLFVP